MSLLNICDKDTGVKVPEPVGIQPDTARIVRKCESYSDWEFADDAVINESFDYEFKDMTVDEAVEFMRQQELVIYAGH